MEPMTAIVDATLPWNHTGIRLEAGREYEITAAGRWVDKEYESGPEGYDDPNLFMRIAGIRKRVTSAKWFALIGALDEDEATQFVIGQRVLYTPQRAGELTCFANDWRSKYDNNCGTVTVTVTPRF